MAAPVSGAGTVVECTLSVPSSESDVDEVEVIASIALREDPRLIFVTTVAGCAEEEVVVGLQVQAEPTRVGDGWQPTFRPRTNVIPISRGVGARTAHRSAARSTRLEERVALTGVGRTAFSRSLVDTSAMLAVEAGRAAIADAGLNPAEIDGICFDSSVVACGGANSPGHADLARALGLRHLRHFPREVPGPAGGVVDAMVAVTRGACRNVLCVTVMGTGSGRLDEGAVLPADNRQWWLARGAVSPLNQAALTASRYLARHGLGRQALGWLAVASRRHAQRNPDALCRSPLDIEAYLTAEEVSTPLSRLDCGLACDGAVGLVVSASSVAPDLAQRPVWLNAVGSAHLPPRTHANELLASRTSSGLPSSELWSRASLDRADIDFLSADDTFTFNALAWVEALGFCAPGEAAEFVEGGVRIGPDGVLPLNPDGGQLAAGQSNGYGNIYEAVLQLRGQAEERQIPSARVAAVSNGTPECGTAMLLTNCR